MAEAILRDKRRIMPCCSYCEREYGLGGLFAGVPAILGSDGVEKVIELQLTAAERELFDESINHLRQQVANIDPVVFEEG